MITSIAVTSPQEKLKKTALKSQAVVPNNVSMQKFAGRLEDSFTTVRYYGDPFKAYADQLQETKAYKENNEEWEKYAEESNATKFLKMGFRAAPSMLGAGMGEMVDMPDHNPNHDLHNAEGRIVGGGMGAGLSVYTEPLAKSIVKKFTIPFSQKKYDTARQASRYIQSESDVYPKVSTVAEVADDNRFLWFLGHKDRYGLYEAMESPFDKEQSFTKQKLREMKGKQGTKNKVIPGLRKDLRIIEDDMDIIQMQTSWYKDAPTINPFVSASMLAHFVKHLCDKNLMTLETIDEAENFKYNTGWYLDPKEVKETDKKSEAAKDAERDMKRLPHHISKLIDYLEGR